MSARRDLKDMLRRAVEAGWTVTKTRGCHWLLRSPSGARVVTGSTPSDGRALLNFRADLKRNGLELP